MTRYVYGICYDGEIVYTGSAKNMTSRWNHYKSDHLNVKHKGYRIKIHQFMREKGFDNFSHQIIETVHDITKQGIVQFEAMWQNTLEELGFNLLNSCGAGNGNVRDLNSITYANDQARKREKIPCELCGTMSAYGHILSHQKTQKCLNNRKVASS